MHAGELVSHHHHPFDGRGVPNAEERRKPYGFIFVQQLGVLLFFVVLGWFDGFSTAACRGTRIGWGLALYPLISNLEENKCDAGANDTVARRRTGGNGQANEGRRLCRTKKRTRDSALLAL